jgi:hypothetical protein
MLLLLLLLLLLLSLAAVQLFKGLHLSAPAVRWRHLQLYPCFLLRQGTTAAATAVTLTSEVCMLVRILASTDELAAAVAAAAAAVCCCAAVSRPARCTSLPQLCGGDTCTYTLASNTHKKQLQMLFS